MILGFKIWVMLKNTKVVKWYSIYVRFKFLVPTAGGGQIMQYILCFRYRFKNVVPFFPPLKSAGPLFCLIEETYYYHICRIYESMSYLYDFINILNTVETLYLNRLQVQHAVIPPMWIWRMQMRVYLCVRAPIDWWIHVGIDRRRTYGRVPCFVSDSPKTRKPS